MDSIISYFDTYLKERLKDLCVYPEAYANNMTAYYEREREKVLSSG